MLRLLETTDVRCPRCEYNLRGSRTPRCPECGSPFYLTTTPAARSIADLAGLAGLVASQVLVASYALRDWPRRLEEAGIGLLVLLVLVGVSLHWVCNHERYARLSRAKRRLRATACWIVAGGALAALV